ADHTVTVGGPNKLTYSMTHVNAEVGQKILFVFEQKNHTLTESSWDAPCTQNMAKGSFDTGFIPNPTGEKGAKYEVEYEVKDKEPHYFFCAQGEHCQAGMVFTVNP
ncbi:hypothetical protein EDC01DRAFT_593713, partial [Geopyxis carbonaria]